MTISVTTDAGTRLEPVKKYERVLTTGMMTSAATSRFHDDLEKHSANSEKFIDKRMQLLNFMLRSKATACACRRISRC
jgi:hypothetical protein